MLETYDITSETINNLADDLGLDICDIKKELIDGKNELKALAYPEVI